MSEPTPTHAERADHDVVIIGAGPAGLTAAYMLTKRGVAPTVLEADYVVGGISRTAVRDGWRFDIGGHRFFTKVKPVDDLWFEILGPDDFLRRPRMSHIHYRGKLYDYPIKPLNALEEPRARRGGAVRGARTCGCGSGRRRTRTTLEGYVVAQLRLAALRPLLQDATTRRCGACPASEIAGRLGRAAHQGPVARSRAVWEPLTPKSRSAAATRRKQVTSLIEEFNYPKYGPGQMWETVHRARHRRAAPRWSFDSVVTSIEHADGRATAVTADERRRDQPLRVHRRRSRRCRSARCSEAMDPPVPAEVLKAADVLRYRDFITVALVVPEEFGFPDNWIYIHDPDVEVGRVQNFGSLVAVPREGRPHLPRARVLRATRATRCGRRPTTTSSSRPSASSQHLGLRRRVEGRGGLRRAHAEGVPVLRRGLQGSTSTTLRALARGAHAQRVSGRPQRHAPLQQPGPLDVHRDALGREHLRRPPRRVVGERRRGVPRRGRATTPRNPHHGGDMTSVGGIVAGDRRRRVRVGPNAALPVLRRVPVLRHDDGAAGARDVRHPPVGAGAPSRAGLQAVARAHGRRRGDVLRALGLPAVPAVRRPPARGQAAACAAGTFLRRRVAARASRLLVRAHRAASCSSASCSAARRTRSSTTSLLFPFASQNVALGGGPGHEGNYAIPQAWSLTAEFVFYLMLPAARALARPARREEGAVAADAPRAARVPRRSTSFGQVFRLYFLTAHPSWERVATIWPPNWVDFFAIGMAMATFSAWEHAGGGLPSLPAVPRRPPGGVVVHRRGRRHPVLRHVLGRPITPGPVRRRVLVPLVPVRRVRVLPARAGDVR